MKKALYLLFLGYIYLNDLGAQTIQIGTGTSTNSVTQSSPINISYRRTVCQFVYTKAELNAAGINSARDLQKFGFYVANAPIYPLPGYTIKMKHVTVSNVNSALGTTGWTTVKNSFTYSPQAGGYDMITLDTPFSWNGVDNIGIEICWSQVQPNWDPSGQIRIFSSNRGYRYSWTDAAGSSCGSTPGTRVNYKPQCQMTFDTYTTWTGAVSTDWFNNSNWTANVPNEEMDAIIPSGAGNMPVINSGTAICKNIQITSGASLTINSGATLKVNEDWTNNGALNGQGTVEFVKNNVQNQILGSVSQTFYNLTINSNYGANVGISNINILGELKVIKGKFNTNNAVTLISNATRTACIPELKTGCLYQLVMNDSWGDGWNGGYITVNVDGVYFGDYFAKSASTTDTLFISGGSTIELNYTAGSYENENSYTLLDPTGTPIFSDGPTPSTANPVFTTTSTCGWSNPIVGNITMQRYINAGATNWRFLTSPVAGATLQQLNDDFVTSGFPGSDWPNWPTASNPWPSIYFYDETKPGIQDSGFVPATNITNSLNPGVGVWVWCGDTITGTQPFTIDYTGAPNAGDISLPMSYTNSGSPFDDGWTMVGNPYPCTIDWDSPNWTKSNINNSIYIWNPNSQQFASYVGGTGLGTNGGSQYIASSQAIWVQANGPSPQLIATEAVKTTIDQSFIKQSNNNPGVSIKITRSGYSDENILRIDPNATMNFDSNLDAYKLYSTSQDVPSLAMLSPNGDELSINSIPSIVNNVSIPIKATTNISGLHQIQFTNINNLGNVGCLYLKDLITGTQVDLTINPTYTFYLSDTTQSARFILTIGQPINKNVNNVTCNGYNDGSIEVSGSSNAPWTIIWEDQNNNIIKTDSNIFTSSILNNISAGSYIVTIENNGICAQSKEIIEVTQPDPVIADFNSIDTLFLTQTNTISFVNNSINAQNYFWDFGDGNTSTLPSPIHAYQNQGVYNIELIAYKNNCTDTTNKLLTVLNNPLSIDQISNEEEINVYTSDGHIFVSGKLNQLTNIEVYDVVGKLIFSTNNFNKNNLAIPLNKSYSKGILLVKLTFNGDKINTYKVVNN
ncbi:MAG: hypothetical protein Kow0079_13440 [Vicingaceae bacterium]